MSFEFSRREKLAGRALSFGLFVLGAVNLTGMALHFADLPTFLSEDDTRMLDNDRFKRILYTSGFTFFAVVGGFAAFDKRSLFR